MIVSRRQLYSAILLLTVIIVITSPVSSANAANDYTNSTHGNNTIGVDRNAMSDYATGNCGHCHEQHASVKGATSGPFNYSLFYENFNFTSPSTFDGVCFQCHDGSSTVQSSSFTNYSYSYQAGGWSAGSSPSNIADFFDITHPQISSYHHLDDIVTFIDTNLAAAGWGYSADSNPCVACHDPHAAQQDPKTGTRGWLLSRPSQHAASPWDLWGNVAAERMNVFANPNPYQAPYQFGTTAAYEPDGSATTDGSNLTDFATFCSDCHNATNTITSTTLNPSLLYIDWANEKHGSGNADVSVCLDNPYDPGSTPAAPLNHVVSCMDCHESHGSSNAYIVRPEVNGNTLGATLTSSTSLTRPAPGAPVPLNTATWPGTTTSWQYLCNRCHKDDSEADPVNCAGRTNSWFIVHHDTTTPNLCNNIAEAPYNPGGGGGGGCGTCHGGGPGGPGPWTCTTAVSSQINCDACHFHGSTDAASPNPTSPSRRTF